MDRLWATAGRLGVVMNVALNPEKHLELAAIAKRYPNVPTMLDHCLNLSAGTGDVPQELLAHPSMIPGSSGRAVTLDTLFALSKLANVYAKLSCVGTGSQQVYPCRDMHDDCRAVIDAFGPQRCVWGSGFPCEVWSANVSYAEHLRVFTHELGLDQQAQQAILGETARRLWFQR